MGLPCAILFIPCGSPRMQVLFLVLHVATKAGDVGEVKGLAQTVTLGLNPTLWGPRSSRPWGEAPRGVPSSKRYMLTGPAERRKGEGIFMVNCRVIVTAQGTRNPSFLIVTNSDFKQKYVIYA